MYRVYSVSLNTNNAAQRGLYAIIIARAMKIRPLCNWLQSPFKSMTLNLRPISSFLSLKKCMVICWGLQVWSPECQNGSQLKWKIAKEMHKQTQTFLLGESRQAWVMRTGQEGGWRLELERQVSRLEHSCTMGHERLLSPLWQALSQVPPPQPWKGPHMCPHFPVSPLFFPIIPRQLFLGGVVSLFGLIYGPLPVRSSVLLRLLW